MTGVTLRSRCNMGCGFGLGIDRNISAGMAGGAITCGNRAERPRVAHVGRSEGRVIAVTYIAGSGCGDVRTGLAARTCPVMAGGTSTSNNAGMRETGG